MNNELVFLAHVGATWFMTGLIWFVQIVHYPLMQYVGRNDFVDYSRRHQSSTSLVVGPPMLVELLTTGLLLTRDVELRQSGAFIVACGLLCVIWVSTVLWQMPLHQQLLAGFDENRVRALVHSNWVRTAAWTARSVIVTWLLLGSRYFTQQHNSF